MILLKAVLTIKPECLAEFRAHLPEFLATCRAEPGCVAFDVCADVMQPNRLMFIEQWHDRFALGRHEDSAHLADFKTNIMPLLKGKQPTEVFFVEHVQEW